MSKMHSFRFDGYIEHELLKVMSKTGLNATDSVELAINLLSWIITNYQSKDCSPDRLMAVIDYHLEHLL